MYLRFARRIKNGKEHRYWSIAESKRCAGGKVVQRPVLYLGEINDSQHADWCRVIETLDADNQRYRQLALFPADRNVPEHAKGYGVQVRLEAMQLHRPRQWGACWLACELYEQLQLDRFWAARLPDSREGTSWRHILQTLVCYRLIDPGSEWRLHRLWFEQSAMGDLLGEDYSRLRKTRSTAVSINSLCTSRRFSVISESAGRTCLGPNSTSCSMISRVPISNAIRRRMRETSAGSATAAISAKTACRL